MSDGGVWVVEDRPDMVFEWTREEWCATEELCDCGPADGGAHSRDCATVKARNAIAERRRSTVRGTV